MKAIHITQSLGAVSLALLLTGCFDEKMPEVNDINCQHENILKIEDKEMQQEFASKCLRRGSTNSSSNSGPRSGGTFQPSPPKSW